jgi:hypothetical protein
MVATLLRSCENNGFAKAIEKRGSRIDAKIAILAVDAKNDWDRTFDLRFLEDRGGGSRTVVGTARIRGNHRSDDSGCCCGSGGYKKTSAGWPRRSRLRIVRHMDLLKADNSIEASK